MERICSLVSDFVRVSLFWADFIFRAQPLEDFSRKPTKVCIRRLFLFFGPWNSGSVSLAFWNWWQLCLSFYSLNHCCVLGFSTSCSWSLGIVDIFKEKHFGMNCSVSFLQDIGPFKSTCLGGFVSVAPWDWRKLPAGPLSHGAALNQETTQGKQWPRLLGLPVSLLLAMLALQVLTALYLLGLFCWMFFDLKTAAAVFCCY